MTQAFNLSQLGNNINSSGQVSMTAGVTGTLPIANGGTNSTATATNGGAAYGTGTALAYTAAGTSGYVLTSTGANAPIWAATSSGASYRIKTLLTGTTYTVASDVKSFYVFVVGSTGGQSNNGGGGRGGKGYSEKYYATPSASYTYSLGAGGSTSGTSGGTTTFDTISITGSGGVTTGTGSSGGVASGGTFNASGGSGGSNGDNANAVFGGSGASGSRAGNGYSGGNGTTGCPSSNGGGGGTGGAGSTGNVAGIAATTKAAGALTLPWSTGSEIFQPGSGGSGASAISYSTQITSGYVNLITNYNNNTSTAIGAIPPYSSVVLYLINITVTNNVYGSNNQNSSIAGSQGAITIVEVL